jgi:hypothetical protein
MEGAVTAYEKDRQLTMIRVATRRRIAQDTATLEQSLESVH